MYASRFSLLALMLFFAVAPASGADHYRHIVSRETPIVPYAGIHQIDEDTAMSGAHYAFRYDEEGRVVRIAHQIGDDVIRDNGSWDGFIWFAPRVDITYEAGRGAFNASDRMPEDGVRFSYDAQGRVIRIMNYIDGRPANLGSIGAATVLIEYSVGYETRTFWDAMAAADAVWRICYRGLEFDTEGIVHKEVFELDERSLRTALRVYDKHDDPTTTYFGAHDYAWTWLDDKKVIEMRQGPKVVTIPMTHFFDFTRTRISFDNRGIHWKIENINENGALQHAETSSVAFVRFEYSEMMNEADYSFYDADDPITERLSFGPMPYGYARITNSFGEDGRLLEEAYRDRFNQLTNNSSGFARAVYDYDSEGRFLSTHFVSLDGKLINYRRPH